MSRGIRDLKGLVAGQRPTMPSGPLQQPRRYSGPPKPQQTFASNNEPPDPNKQADQLVDILKGKLDRQRDELDDRTDSINALQRNFEQLSKLYSGEKNQFQELRDKLAAANQEIENLKSQLKVLVVIQREYEVLSAKYKVLKESSALEISERDNQIVELQQRLEELLEQLRRSEALRRDEVDKQSQASMYLEGERERLETELKKLEQQLTELTDANIALKATTKKQREELEAAQNALNIKTAKIQALETTDKQTEAEKKRLTLCEARQGMELTELQNKLQEKEMEHLKQIQALQQQHRQGEEEALVARQQAVQSIEELEQALKDKQQLLDAFEKDRSAYEQKISELENENGQLKERVQQLTDEMNLMNSQMERERNGAEGAVKQLTQVEHERRMKHQKDLGSLMSEREGLKKEINKLKAEIGSLQQQLNEADTIRRELEEAQEYIEKQSVHIDELERKCQQLGLSLESFQQTNATAQQNASSDLSRLQSLLNTATTENDSLIHKNSTLTDELNNLKLQLQHTQESLCNVNTQYSKSQQDITELQKRCDSLTSKIKELEGTLHDSTRKNSDLMSVIQNKEMECMSLQSELANLKNVVSSLEDENRALHEKQKEKDDTIEKGMKKLTELRSEVGKTIKKLITAEEAQESNLSCLICLEMLHDPVMCVPCGHVFCSECIDKESCQGGSGKKPYCPECKLNNISTMVPQDTLDRLSGAFAYRKQTLHSLLELAKTS